MAAETMITNRTKADFILVSLVTLLAMAVLFSSCSDGSLPSPSDNRSDSPKPSSQVAELPVSSLEILSFQAQPKRIKLGETTTLSWDIAGATSFTIDPSAGPATGNRGSTVISPKETTLYTLKATDGNYETTARFLVITESKEGSILWPVARTDNATGSLPHEGWTYYPSENVDWVVHESFKHFYTEDTDYCVQIGTIVNNSNNWTMTDVTMDRTLIANSILPGEALRYTTSVICKDFTFKWRWQVKR